MNDEERLQLLSEAAAEFDRRESRADGMRVATSLSDGLNTLRDILFTRIHVDVEAAIGLDSMLIPTSVNKTVVAAKLEIDIFSVAESAWYVASQGMIASSEAWYAQWLAQLRFGREGATAVAPRIAAYGKQGSTERRKSFSVALERIVPEARRSPLIIYRLLPPAVAIVTTMALGDHQRATESRKQQAALLVCIMECATCHGVILENGEKCPECGNPFWKFEWLTAE